MAYICIYSSSITHIEGYSIWRPYSEELGPNWDALPLSKLNGKFDGINDLPLPLNDHILGYIYMYIIGTKLINY